ncbi:IS1634 family transposase [Pyramidobacter piscolens]|uniref:IS1634 family transposase n=1 Tax=Pyramidobacter piscolens TaxID=638849 RepID=UPI003AF98C63
MAMVKQLDKRSGITYVYESVSYWDKEKKQERSKRTLVGRLDPVSGEIVPTDGRGKRRGQKVLEQPAKQGPVPAVKTDRLFFGATYLLDQIGKLSGVAEDLKTCFPNHYKQILSIAYYLILEDQTPLFRFKKWGKLHRHPYGKEISSQRSSELFQSVTEESKMKFFRLQGKRRVEKEYWAYDSTSVSSYSESLRQVRYGKNKDGESLPQLNLALLFGEESGLPFYYRKLAGNVPDVKTIRELLRDLDILGYSKIKLVMDRGYYSADNMNALFKAHLKFLCGSSTALSFAKQYIREIGGKKDHYTYYNSQLELYVFSKTIAWDYEQERPYKGDVIQGERRMYLHLYYNPEKSADDGKAFNRRLDKLKEELLSGRRNPAHEKDCQKYFEIKETPKRGISLSVKQEAIDAASERYGFFVLVSNEVKDPVRAIQLYRMRDVVEKAFWNVKERLNLRRTLVSSESSLEGKFFVEFVALIYLSYLKKKMEENGLFAQYTLHELLDELDVIECFMEPGKTPIQGEVLKKQEDLFRKLGVKPLLASPDISTGCEA